MSESILKSYVDERGNISVRVSHDVQMLTREEADRIEAEYKRMQAENAKLRELVEGMRAALQAFCDAQDVHGDNCPLWVERTDDCELRGIERRMRELGVDA